MFRFAELSDGTYRLTYIKNDSNVSIDYVGRFQAIENDDSIPEKDGGFKIVLDDSQE